MNQTVADFDVDTYVFQCLRTWRSLVLDAVRVRLTPALGGGLNAAVEDLFQKEWVEVQRSHEHARQSGFVSRAPIDSLDLLGVNHVGNLLEKFWELICPVPNPKGDEAKRALTTLRSWAREISAVRNPVSHPTMQQIELRDGLRCIDTCARFLEVFGVDDAEAIRRLWQLLIDGAAPESPTYSQFSNLPSREQITNEFVGRTSELAEVWRWLTDDHRRVWALVGDGGKGKTTIAYEFATAAMPLLPSFGLQGVVWLTAKKVRFVEGSTSATAGPDFADLRSAAEAIARVLGWEEYADLPTEDLTAQVLDLLRAFPMLVIADDIDSLTASEEDAIEFFSARIPETKCKVLMTSRRRVFGLGAATTDVKGLGVDETLELLRLAAPGLGRDPSAITLSQARDVHRITDGSPLYIDDLLRLARFYSLDRAISEWSGRQGDAAREYSLQKELEKLSKSAQMILGVLSFADSPLSGDECAVICNLSDDDAAASLAELQQWNLLSLPGLVQDVPRFTCSRNLSKLMRRVLAQTDQEQRIVNGLKGLRGVGLPSSRTQQYVRQAIALQRGGKQLDAEAVLLRGLSEVPNSADVLGMLGWLYAKWAPRARVAEAVDHFRRAEALGQWDRNLYAHWADMYYTEREYSSAAEVCRRAVGSLCKDDVFLWRLLGKAETQIGLLERQSFAESSAAAAFDRARRSLSRADALSQSTSDRSRTMRALYDLQRAQGDFKGAEAVLKRWEAQLPGDPFIAHARGVPR